MKVQVTNTTDSTHYLELGNKGDLDKTVALPAKAREPVTFPSEAKLAQIKKQFSGKLLFRILAK